MSEQLEMNEPSEPTPVFEPRTEPRESKTFVVSAVSLALGLMIGLFCADVFDTTGYRARYMEMVNLEAQNALVSASGPVSVRIVEPDGTPLAFQPSPVPGPMVHFEEKNDIVEGTRVEGGLVPLAAGDYICSVGSDELLKRLAGDTPTER